MPLVLWHCWLGSRKAIQPVKNWVVSAGVVICLERGADLHTAELMPLPLTVSCFGKKSRLDLPFWYQLTRVVMDKGPLNGCVCVLQHRWNMLLWYLGHKPAQERINILHQPITNIIVLHFFIIKLAIASLWWYLAITYHHIKHCCITIIFLHYYFYVPHCCSAEWM